MESKRMKYDIKAIETTYRGYLFRSRLEAKWAAFFDLCGWPWGYEPPEYNGWIPDFAIGEPITPVEVKPFYKSDEWDDVIAKVSASGCTRTTVLLGADPTMIPIGEHNAPQLGWLAECEEVWDEEGMTCLWQLQPLHFGVTHGNGKLGLCPLDGAWRNQIWEPPADVVAAGWDNKWARVSLHSWDWEAELIHRWAEATNKSRWMPVAS